MTSAIQQFANTAQLLIWVAEFLPLAAFLVYGIIAVRRNRAL